jgi:hypothetical protein
METKGSESGVSFVWGLDGLQWKYWGVTQSRRWSAFTRVHAPTPTPCFPLELVSRTDRTRIVWSANQEQPGLDPKAYSVKIGNRERALFTYVRMTCC